MRAQAQAEDLDTTVEGDNEREHSPEARIGNGPDQSLSPFHGTDNPKGEHDQQSRELLLVRQLIKLLSKRVSFESHTRKCR